jgi:cytochrome b
MQTILVWDIPARLFHWGFAISITAAITIGLLVDDERSLFQLHMLFGIVALFLLIIRLLMGVVGSRYSRFTSYPIAPREISRYVISAIVSKTKLYAGNNPGSAVAAVLMFLLVVALFASGIGSDAEAIEELHEFFAWALLAVIVLHLAGLLWHTIRHRENIALTMVTGKKSGKPEDAISSSHAAWGVVILVVSGIWIAALFASHNATAATVELPGIGVVLDLGEHESGGDQPEHHRDDND